LNLGSTPANGGSEVRKVSPLPESTHVRLIVVHKECSLRTLNVGTHHFEPPRVFGVTVLVRQGNAEGVVGVQCGDSRASIANRISLCLNGQFNELIANHGVFQNGGAVSLKVMHGVHQVFETYRLHRVSAGLTGDYTSLVLERLHRHSPTTALIAQQARCGNPRVGEEGLIKAVLTGHFSDGPRLNTSNFHWG